jgi:hypothetical protein
MSARENIIKDIVQQLKNMSPPTPGLVDRKFFDFEKLAITQYPAILVTSGNETRSDISMTEKQAILNVVLRCYVRGTEIDTLRNDFIENLEQTLEQNRDRNQTYASTGLHNVVTRITNIEVVDRNPPIGEFTITAEITYIYRRGNA